MTQFRFFWVRLEVAQIGSVTWTCRQNVHEMGHCQIRFSLPSYCGNKLDLELWSTGRPSPAEKLLAHSSWSQVAATQSHHTWVLCCAHSLCCTDVTIIAAAYTQALVRFTKNVNNILRAPKNASFIPIAFSSLSQKVVYFHGLVLAYFLFWVNRQIALTHAGCFLVYTRFKLV